MPGGVRLEAGSLFAGDYRVIQPLGAGGMGAVYLVEQQSTGARRALKLMLPSIAENPEARRRFEREAKAASLIDSDHVVQVLAAGVDDATSAAWLVMELLEGADLAAFARQHDPLPMADVVEIVRQVGHALAAAHAAGVVHRDLKPENLFVGSARRSESRFTVKVLDFGIAKFVAESSHSSGTAAVGSLAWMAPEQTETGASLSPATDVFAFGLVAFWMLTGKPYWRAANTRTGSAPELLREILFEPMPAASERAAALATSPVPRGFDAWFARAVARDPAARFSDGGLACAALVRVLECASPDTLEPVPTSLATAPTKIAEAIPGRRSRRAARRLATAGGVVVALAAASALMLARARTGADATPAPASSAPAPRATPITARPPPNCRSPKVLSLYQEALQEFRDANWTHALARLEEAAKLEPECAAVELRMAMACDDRREARASLQRAIEHRTSLDERDVALLNVIELTLREPPDHEAIIGRARAAAERYPDDAELIELFAQYQMNDAATALALAKRATEIDPIYADAWQERGKQERKLGHDDEALAAVDRCIEVSPTTTDCRRDRGRLLIDAGRCVEAEREFRQASSSSPKDRSSREEWVDVLYELDRPKETVAAALEDKWSILPEAERPLRTALDLALLHRSFGETASVEADLADAEALAAKSGDPSFRLPVLAAQVEWLAAIGKFKEAGKAADELVKRSSTPNEDGTPFLAYFRHRAGLLDGAALEAARVEWTTLHLARGGTPWKAWKVSYGVVAVDEELAAAAIAHVPPGPVPRFAAASLGAAFSAVGRFPEALPLLRGDGCVEKNPVFAFPIARALEGTGDTAGACARYVALEARHGASSPLLVAKRAHERIARLHCAPP